MRDVDIASLQAKKRANGCCHFVFFATVPIVFAGAFATAWLKDSICKKISKQL